MIQGDISKFAPADLLLFLSHMNKEGVLFVHQGEVALTLSFRGQLLVDAGCEAADDLVLEILARRQAASGQTLAYLRQAREETGLPLSRILDDVKWLSVSDAGQAVAAGVRETVFRLLLWEQGEFKFNEIPIEDNPVLPPLDALGLVMDLTREVDEYRELLRQVGPLDRSLQVVTGSTPAAEASAEEQYVLAHAAAFPTAEDLLAAAPFPRLSAAQAVARAFETGRLEFKASDPVPATGAQSESCGGGALPAFDLVMRTLQETDNPEARVREVLGFAQGHCAQTILFGISAGHLKRATVYRPDADGRLTAIDHREPKVDLAADPFFHQVLTEGQPYVGAAFSSSVIDALEAEVAATHCGLLPLGTLGELELLLHAVTVETDAPGGPLACLVDLSRQIQAPQVSRVPAAADAPIDAETENALSLLDDDDGTANELVKSIKGLPPMPSNVSRILALLSCPDCEMKELVDALSVDPALLAQVIKVSNSALYGGHQEIGSIKLAIMRLGMRTTRSVVVAASTRTLFPMDNSHRGLLGRALWEHSVQTGLAGRRVAEFTRGADPDEAFAAGVLHDIGKVILLLTKPDEFFQVHEQLEKGATESVSVERQHLGFDHCLLGDRLLENWGMPANLRAVVRWHHQPEMAREAASLVQVVACADVLSQKVCGHSSFGSRLAERLTKACTALNLEESSCADLENLLRTDLEKGDLFA